VIGVQVVPVVTVEVDGVALAASDARALAEVRVRQVLSQPTQCELTFADPPGPLAPIVRLQPGVSLRVAVAGQADALFAGQVTAVEQVYGPNRRREVRLRAYDLLHRLRKRQSVRVYQQLTVADLARELAGGVGLDVEAEEDGPLWPTLIQYRQTDLDFLQELAERCGLYLTARDETLHLVTLNGIGEDVPLALGDALLEARVEANGDPAARRVTADAWDPLLASPHVGRAAGPRVGREVAVEVDPGNVGGDGERVLLDVGAPADPVAEAAAQAELDRAVGREVTLWGIAEGNPRLRPGTPVAVSGVDDRFAGRYVLTEVTHVVDERAGFVSEITTTPPLPGPRRRAAVVSLGVVTRVDDPNGLGRVKVSLPTFGDVETDWMGVLCAAAGRAKGLIMLPDVGDHVAVLFAHEDPGQGIVLGGLYGTQGPPDSGVDGGAVRRFVWTTPDGQRIQLDDARRAIRLDDHTGSFVELSPSAVRIHAAVNLQIEAPGQPIVIRGRSIDFESA
jgi:phage baseplate assembly protein V